MKKLHVPMACICMVLSLCATVGPTAALEPDLDPLERETTEEPPRKLALGNWYVGIGATNYHPGLRESEAQIDRQLNRLFGWLPCWKRPTTFADWRDKFVLWDLTIGAGRDITPRTTLMVWTGGMSGTIKNKERYGPIATDIRFTRTSFFVIPEFFYYPRGKVDYSAAADAQGWDRVRAALAGTKPYMAVAAGYSFVRAEADVKFKTPILGTILRQSQSEDHHMYTISPRLGVEMPVGKNTSVAPVVMYLFNGPRHGDEYNGPALSFSIRRRF